MTQNLPPEAYPDRGSPSADPAAQRAQQEFARQAQEQQLRNQQEYRAEQFRVQQLYEAERVRLAHEYQAAEQARQFQYSGATPFPGSQTPAQVHVLAPMYPVYGPPLPPKDLAVTYVLLIFLGVLGIHRFYLGHVGLGLLFLFTGGLFGIGWFVDLFLMPGTVRTMNARRAAGLL